MQQLQATSIGHKPIRTGKKRCTTSKYSLREDVAFVQKSVKAVLRKGWQGQSLLTIAGSIAISTIQLCGT